MKTSIAVLTGATAVAGISLYVYFWKNKALEESAAKERVERELAELKAKEREKTLIMVKCGAALCGVGVVVHFSVKLKNAILRALR